MNINHFLDKLTNVEGVLDKFRFIPRNGQMKILAKVAICALVAGILVGLAVNAPLGITVSAVVSVGAFVYFTNSYGFMNLASDAINMLTREH